VALEQIFSEYFDFPCQFSFHRLFHTYHLLSSGAGTTGQTVPNVSSGLSLTPLIFLLRDRRATRLTPLFDFIQMSSVDRLQWNKCNARDFPTDLEAHKYSSRDLYVSSADHFDTWRGKERERYVGKFLANPVYPLTIASWGNPWALHCCPGRVSSREVPPSPAIWNPWNAFNM
jgi:hypothetical protein